MRPEVDWVASEKGAGFALEEAKRLLRRARARLVWLAVLGVVLAGAYVTKRALAKPLFEGEVILRIVEDNKELTEVVRPPSHYFDIIWGVFFSSPRLRKIIEDHNIYADKLARDPQLAVEAFRNDLDVKVWRDYFDPEFTDAFEARTARVAITWSFKDPEVTLAVVRALGDVVVAAQTEDRRLAFEDAQQEVADATEEAYERLLAVRRAIVMKNAELQRARGPREAALRVQLRDLAFDEKELGARVAQLRNAATRFDITAAVERQRSGIRFEVIEPGLVVPQKLPGPIATTITAVSIFALSILLGGMLAGAFEVRVRQPADVRRMGMNVLGSVQPFRGDAAGALVERLDGADRIRLERP